MPSYFPRHTANWKVHEPPAFRQLTLSLVEMAVATGILLRLGRAVALTRGASDSWMYLAGVFSLGAVFLFGMATLHLGNYTLRQWVWRAPAFAAIEAAAEAAVSALLILLHREPMGTARAELHDWFPMALETLVWRVAAVITFALVLAGIVQLVRYLLLRRDNRLHTAEAVHEDFERHTAERERVPESR